MRYFPLLVASLLVPATACSRSPDGAALPDRVPVAESAGGPRADDPSRAPPPHDTTVRFADGKRTLDAIKDTLLKRYDAVGLTEDDLYRAAARGMLEHASPAASPYDELLSPSELVEMKKDLGGEVPGIGYRYDFDEARGQVQISSIIPGSPAEKGGLRAGDLVLRQDGRLLKGMTAAEFRGQGGVVGQPMDMVVLRDDAILHLSIVRGLVSFDEVATAMFGDVGYVLLHGFSANSASKTRAALAEVEKAGAHAVVVDLRANTGGDFDGAVATSGVLLPEGASLGALVTRGKKEPLVAHGPGPLVGAPIAVLVDEETAAGAELLAAALAQSRHAKLVGGRTRGKWSVENLDVLPNGYAIKYAAAHLVTADGTYRMTGGLAPDLELKPSKDDLAVLWAPADPERRLRLDAGLRAAIELVRAHR